MRSMVDVNGTAPYCKMEELDRRNRTNRTSSSSLPVQEIDNCAKDRKHEATLNFEDTENKKSLYLDASGTKPRTFPKFTDRSSPEKIGELRGPRQIVKGDQGRKFFFTNKNRRNREKKWRKRQKWTSDHNNRSSFRPQPKYETRVGQKQDMALEEISEKKETFAQRRKVRDQFKFNDRIIDRRVCSKQTDLKKTLDIKEHWRHSELAANKESRGENNESYSGNSYVDCKKRSSFRPQNKHEIRVGQEHDMALEEICEKEEAIAQCRQTHDQVKFNERIIDQQVCSKQTDLKNTLDINEHSQYSALTANKKIQGENNESYPGNSYVDCKKRDSFRPQHKHEIRVGQKQDMASEEIYGKEEAIAQRYKTRDHVEFHDKIIDRRVCSKQTNLKKTMDIKEHSQYPALTANKEFQGENNKSYLGSSYVDCNKRGSFRPQHKYEICVGQQQDMASEEICGKEEVIAQCCQTGDQVKFNDRTIDGLECSKQTDLEKKLDIKEHSQYLAYTTNKEFRGENNELGNPYVVVKRGRLIRNPKSSRSPPSTPKIDTNVLLEPRDDYGKDLYLSKTARPVSLMETQACKDQSMDANKDHLNNKANPISSLSCQTVEMERVLARNGDSSVKSKQFSSDRSSSSKFDRFSSSRENVANVNKTSVPESTFESKGVSLPYKKHWVRLGTELDEEVMVNDSVKVLPQKKRPVRLESELPLKKRQIRLESELDEDEMVNDSVKFLPQKKRQVRLECELDEEATVSDSVKYLPHKNHWVGLESELNEEAMVIDLVKFLPHKNHHVRLESKSDEDAMINDSIKSLPHKKRRVRLELEVDKNATVNNSVISLPHKKRPVGLESELDEETIVNDSVKSLPHKKCPVRFESELVKEAVIHDSVKSLPHKKRRVHLACEIDEEATVNDPVKIISLPHKKNQVQLASELEEEAMVNDSLEYLSNVKARSEEKHDRSKPKIARKEETMVFKVSKVASEYHEHDDDDKLDLVPGNVLETEGNGKEVQKEALMPESLDVIVQDVANFSNVQSDSKEFVKVYEGFLGTEYSRFSIEPIPNGGQKMFHNPWQNVNMRAELDPYDGLGKFYSEVDPVPITGPPGSFLPSPCLMAPGNSLVISNLNQSSKDGPEFADMDSMGYPTATSRISSASVDAVLDNSPLNLNVAYTGVERLVSAEPTTGLMFREREPFRFKNDQPHCYPREERVVLDAAAALNYQDPRTVSLLPQPVTDKQMNNENVTTYQSEHIQNENFANSEVKFRSKNIDGDTARSSKSNTVFRLMGKDIVAVNKGDE